MAQFELDYQPTAKQQLFHASGAYELLYGGAAGGGKSRAVVMEAVVDALEHPGVHSYLFRRSYPQLRDTLIREALTVLPRGLYQYRQQTHDLFLPGGSVLHFRSCRGPQDAYQYQGSEFNRLFIDELTQFEKETYDYLKTRVRAKKALGVRPFIRCTANPGGLGHGWVKAYFIDALEPYAVRAFSTYSQLLGENTVQTRQYIPATARDNPHLHPGYIAELEQKPEALRRALLLGDWNVFDGQVFGEFCDDASGYESRELTHVIRPFSIPEDFTIYRGFDWGYTRPYAVGYWAKSPDDVLYRFAEIYGCEPGQADRGLRQDPRTVARRVADFERRELPGRKILGIAGPSIGDESRGEDGCIAAIFAREGLYFAPGDNRRLPGKMQLHTRLRFDQNGRPGLYVFSSCTEFIRTLPALVYDRQAPEDVDTRGEDHIYDESRYVCMACPMVNPPPPPRALRPPKDDPLELAPARPRPQNPYDRALFASGP